MKKHVIYFLLILPFPFLVMMAVNEYVRLYSVKSVKHINEVTAINSSNRLITKCSWACHNDTEYCKKNHVKFASTYFHKIDPIYFGIIQSLKSTGNYGVANIIFLVILIPLVLFFLLVKSINIQCEIREIKKELR